MLTDFTPFLSSLNMQAFFHLIRVGEGTADALGYRRVFGGDLFTDFSVKPRTIVVKRNKEGKIIRSSAAGAYQINNVTEDSLQAIYHFLDFSPLNQDKRALAIIDWCHAIDIVMKGDIRMAIPLCAERWASLPGSPYGQPMRTLPQALEAYAEAGGILSATG